MPKTKSAKKARRQNLRRRAKNLKQLEALKTVVKTFRGLVAEGRKEEAAKYLSLVYKTLDKSAKSGVIKANKAARLKARLSLKLK